MLEDVVVDTNVLVHAQNPREARFGAAVAFVETMINASSTTLRVDAGFSLVESENASLICSEYLQHLRAGQAGYVLLVALASNGRVRAVEKKPTVAVRKSLRQMITNKRDRTFVEVAYESVARVLVTHDFADFTLPKRAALHRRHDLTLTTADNATALVLR